jgi:Fungal N-terminal domain of STAND proteins
MDPITAIGLVASISQLADQAGRLFVSLFDYYREVKEAPARSKELRDEVQAVADLLDSLKKIVSKANTGSRVNSELLQLNESIPKCEEFLRELEARTLQTRSSKSTKTRWSFWNDSSTLDKLKWPFTKEENKRLLDALGRYKENFSWALNMQQTYFSSRLF